MSARAVGYRRFVRAVHSRYVLIRLAERAGVGVLGGCVAVLPLLGIAIYRGLAVMAAAGVAIGVGLIAGIAYGWLTRPTELQSAVEADRQLDWADVLSTAMTMESRLPGDRWVAVVRAEADSRSAGVSPGVIVLRRLGARAWGGIGLATALVIVLGLFPTFASPTNAGDRSSSATSPWAENPQERQGLSSSAPFTRGSARQEDPDDPNASRLGNAEAASPEHADGASTDTGTSTSHKGSTDPNGQGTGASHSQTSRSDGLPTASAGTDSSRETPQGTAAGGVGKLTGSPGGSGDAGGSMAGGEKAGGVPPWESKAWHGDVERAENAIRSGQLPDAYRDLVRDYFDRSSSSPPADASGHDR